MSDAGVPGTHDAGALDGGDSAGGDDGSDLTPDAAPADDGDTGNDGLAGGDDGSGDDGGDDGASDGSGDDGAPDGQVPAIIAVGYGGLRLISRDNGLTWGSRAALTDFNADDENLLRGAAWGNGTWVVTGFKTMLSNDGVTWTEATDVDAELNDIGCNLMESVAFGNGIFVGACGNGPGFQGAFISSNGRDWESAGHIGDTQGHTWVQFYDGQFVASGDSANSFVSTDGRNWQPLSGVQGAQICDGEVRSRGECPREEIWLEDIYLRGRWGGHIDRSTNGEQWMEDVYRDADELNPYYFARGYAAP